MYVDGSCVEILRKALYQRKLKNTRKELFHALIPLCQALSQAPGIWFSLIFKKILTFITLGTNGLSELRT